MQKISDIVNNPLVTCVMLTKDRPALVRKAVECFRTQTYDAARRQLLIYDTGDAEWFFDNSDAENEGLVSDPLSAGLTVGALRNAANGCVVAGSLILHWDDDDYSHPRRIEEQVDLWQKSDGCCGYNEMLFWDERGPGEAWIYAGSVLGTSLCYSRARWEAIRFQPVNQGEDTQFRGARCIGVSSVNEDLPDEYEPRMIARIHGGNTSIAYDPQVMRAVEKQGGEWRRAPQWEAYCRKVMA